MLRSRMSRALGVLMFLSRANAQRVPLALNEPTTDPVPPQTPAPVPAAPTQGPESPESATLSPEQALSPPVPAPSEVGNSSQAPALPGPVPPEVANSTSEQVPPSPVPEPPKVATSSPKQVRLSPVPEILRSDQRLNKKTTAHEEIPSQSPVNRTFDQKNQGPSSNDDAIESKNNQSKADGPNTQELLTIILACVATFLALVALFVLRVAKAQSERAPSICSSRCSHENDLPIPGLPRTPSDARMSTKLDRADVEITPRETAPVIYMPRAPTQASSVRSPSVSFSPSVQATGLYERRSSETNFLSEYSTNSYLSSFRSSLESLRNPPSELG